MKLIRELTNQDLGIANKNVCYQVRKAARGILFDGESIALLHVKKEGYHKLPGGGMEDGETVEQCLHREVREETGCRGKLTKPVGIVIEYRDDYELLQISYCFMMELQESNLGDNFDQKEIDDGFKLEWYRFDEAIETLEREKPSEYGEKFINARDLLFLNEMRRNVL